MLLVLNLVNRDTWNQTFDFESVVKGSHVCCKV